MAKTIGQLTQATTLASGDEFVIEQSGLTKRIAASVVRGGLVNADIDAAAAIAHTKLANITAGRVLLGNASNAPTATELTGDVTVSSTGVTSIAANAVVTADIADANVTAAKLSGAQTGSAPIYACRAWVNFDGTRNEGDTGASTNGANVKIRGSGNVASVLKNAIGDYTVTFTTAMPDANYAVLGSVAGSTTVDQRSFITASNAALAAGSVRVLCVDVNNTVNDCNSQQVAILR
jgi:hypothetical protein